MSHANPGSTCCQQGDQSDSSGDGSVAHPRARTLSARRSSVKFYPKNPDRLGDVLDPVLPHGLEPEGEFLLHLSRHLARHADTVRIGQLLEPRGDVDAIAIAVLSLDDDLAEIDADADMDAPALWDVGVALGHAPLQAHYALDRIDDAAEFRQQFVTHKFEDAAVMAGDFRFEQFLAPRPEALEGTLFVLLHKGGVADDISANNGSKLTVHDRVPLLNRDCRTSRLSQKGQKGLSKEARTGSVSATDLIRPAASESSVSVAERVALARNIQRRRHEQLGFPSITTNAQCSVALIEQVAKPDGPGFSLLQQASEQTRSRRAPITVC
jgi:hypothetical protein